MPAVDGEAFFHPAIGGDGLVAELPVEGVGVAGGEAPAAEGLEAWVGFECVEHGFGQTMASMRGIDDDVAEPGEGGLIGDDACEADLGAAGLVERAGDDAVADGRLEDVLADVGRPVRRGEQSVDAVELHTGWVEGDRVAGALGAHAGSG